MRLESNQQCREAGDLQSPGVTSFPTHPYFGSPSTDRTYDIFVNSEAQLPLCYRGIDWLQRQDSHLRSPAYETGEDDWTPLLCDNWCPGRDSNSQLTASKTAVFTNFTTGALHIKTHSRSAARKALYPQWSMTRPNVFLYGVPTGIRTPVLTVKG